MAEIAVDSCVQAVRETRFGAKGRVGVDLHSQNLQQIGQKWMPLRRPTNAESGMEHHIDINSNSPGDFFPLYTINEQTLFIVIMKWLYS